MLKEQRCLGVARVTGSAAVIEADLAGVWDADAVIPAASMAASGTASIFALVREIRHPDRFSSTAGGTVASALIVISCAATSTAPDDWERQPPLYSAPRDGG